MNIIIADDEKWVRAVISNTIPYEKLGLNLVCEASDGLEALELCKLHKPDILLTDIAMPGMSGLELIHELKKVLPDTKIIIISGYSDFDYAKKAIKYGVNDYILKPVDEDELTNVLTNVKELIINERSRIETEKAIKSEYSKALPIVCEKFLNQLIQPNILTADAVKSRLASYDIHLNYNLFSILVFIPDEPAAIIDENKNTYYIEFTKRFCRKYLKGICFSKNGANRELVAIVNHKHDSLIYTSSDGTTYDIQTILNTYMRIFKKHFKSSISVGISTFSSSLKSLPELYVQANQALCMGFWNETCKIYIFCPGMFLNSANLSLPGDIMDDIVINIKLTNYQTAYSYINAACSTLKKQGNIKPEEVKDFFWAFVQSLVAKLNLGSSFIESQSTNLGIHPYEKIKASKTLDALNNCIKEMVQDICKVYTAKNPVNRVNIIESARKIIEENYSMDLSLEQVATYVHLSPAYFSEFFKRETGMSFIDYKTNLRIEAAKKLINTTSLSLYEISSRIGYNDPKYFSKLFKKLTGHTPLEFKEKSKI